MPAKLVDRFIAKLVDCLIAKLVDRSTAKLMNRLTTKLVVVNLVKLQLHLNKLKMTVNTFILKALTSHSDAESITSTFLVSLLKL